MAVTAAHACGKERSEPRVLRWSAAVVRNGEHSSVTIDGAEPEDRAARFRGLRERPSFVEAHAGIAESPPAEDVLRGFEPQFEKAARSCQSGEKDVPGDVIIAVTLEDDRQPRFDLDVSRSLGPRVGRCLKRRFRPIVAHFMQNVGIVNYIIHDVIEVRPGSPFTDLDVSLLLPGGPSKRHGHLPPDVSLGPPGCFRVRGTPAFSFALERWLNRVGKRISPEGEKTLASQLGISHGAFMGAWSYSETSLLVRSKDGNEPAESWPTVKLCRVSLDRVSLPPAALPQ